MAKDHILALENVTARKLIELSILVGWNLAEASGGERGERRFSGNRAAMI